MIPKIGALREQLMVEEPSSYTFRLDAGKRVVLGMADGREAMEQAIYLALGTERFQWVIFSWNYGAELGELLGMPISWVIPEAERRITEALMQDSRVLGVEDFSFVRGKGTLLVRFRVRTIFGEIGASSEIRIQSSEVPNQLP